MNFFFLRLMKSRERAVSVISLHPAALLPNQPPKLNTFEGKRTSLYKPELSLLASLLFDYEHSFPNKIICFAATSACRASTFLTNDQTGICKSGYTVYDENSVSLQIKY